MNTAEHKQIVRRFYDEIMNGGNLDLVETLVAKGVVENELIDGAAQGRRGFKAFLEGFKSAFPDAEITVEDMIAEADKVVVRLTIRGTHEGIFMGIGGTGRRFEAESIDIFRFENGLIAEHWGETDILGMLTQLDAVSLRQ